MAKNTTTNEIELGGTLTKPTTFATSAANTLAIAGLQTGASTDNIVVANASGVLKTAGVEGVKVPSGTTSERPSSVTFGTLRYNTTTGRGEMYVNDVNGDGTQGDAGWRPI